MSLVLFHRYVQLCCILDPTYKSYYMVFVFFFLTMKISRSIHIAANGIISFFFGLNNWVSQMALVVKNLPANAGDKKRHGFSPWVRRSWQPTAIFLTRESMDRGAWQAVVHEAAIRHDWNNMHITQYHIICIYTYILIHINMHIYYGLICVHVYVNIHTCITLYTT